MNSPTLFQKLRYSFDNTMSKGTPALIFWLGIVSLLVISFAALLVTFFAIVPEGSQKLDLIEAFWMSMMRALDSGTVAGDNGWPFRLVMFAVTLGGIFIVSTLIGLLSAGIEAKVDELRKGKSLVIENSHTLILGWSPKIFTIIPELVIANESEKRPVVVILADRDKVEMEDEISAKAGDTKNTRVVCRSGSPFDPTDLEIVNPEGAKSIIILSEENEKSDFNKIKSLLALTNKSLKNAEKPLHVVMEIIEEKSADLVKIIAPRQVEYIHTDDIISRIMVQTCRQPGLSVVYIELMDFDGDEMYFAEEKSLVGKSFGEALFAYRDSSVMGICFKSGDVKLNPPMNTEIAEGDRLIAVTRDNSTMIAENNPRYTVNEKALSPAGVKKQSVPESILILGWNKKAWRILRELNNYVAKGSHVKIVSDAEETSGFVESMKQSLEKLEIEIVSADTSDRTILESLKVEKFEHIILLCYDNIEDTQESDARTLATLIHLRDISDRAGADLNIVSEMNDVRNRELAEITKADDFVVSDKLISLLMSQVSENKMLMGAFRDIFDADGSELYIKPASEYVKTGIEIDFYTVLFAARQKNECAIGYRVSKLAADPSKNYGVVINPDKAVKFTLSAEDKLIVVAED